MELGSDLPPLPQKKVNFNKLWAFQVCTTVSNLRLRENKQTTINLMYTLINRSQIVHALLKENL